MLKASFDSLSRRVERQIREWWTGSRGPTRYAGSRTKRILDAVFGRAVWCVLTLLGLKVAIAVLWFFAADHFSLGEKWDNTQFASYFGTLWSVQATITALVYPIVIAFVAVLLQRRATARLSLQLYLREAFVLPAGISALVLLAVMGGEYMAIPYVCASWIAMATAGDGAWFVANAALTGVFLYRTVRYIDDSFRLTVFTRYAVSDALMGDIRSRLAGFIFQNEQPDEATSEDEHQDRQSAKVTFLRWGDAEPAVVLNIRGTHTIVDVRLRLLRAGVKLWLRSQAKAERRASASPARGPLLTIDFTPDDTVSGTTTLCSIQNGVVPGWPFGFLMRKSVVLGRPKGGLSTASFFEELGAETLAYLEQHRYEAATETISGLLDLHAELIKAGKISDGEGNEENAVLLAEPYGFGSRRLHQEWIDSYRELLLAASADANLNSSYYSRCCYLTYRLLNRIRDEHFDIRAEAFRLSTLLAYGLEIWWVSKADEHGLSPRGPQNGVVLPPFLARQYESAMNTFFEAWESLLYGSVKDQVRPADEIWKQCSDYARLSAEYVLSTVKMLGRAVARGDVTASKWFVDSLLKWWDTQGGDWNGYPGTESEFPLHTISSIEANWHDIRLTIENLPEGDEERRVARDLASVILKRYWIDTRLACALALLSWTDAGADASALSFDLAISLLIGRGYREGGTVSDVDLQTFDTMLLHLVRMQSWNPKYTGRIDRIVRTMYEALEPRHPGGRTYMTRGDISVSSLRNQQVELLLAVATVRRRFGTLRVEETLPLWADEPGQMERLRQTTTSLREALDWPGLSAQAALIVLIRQATGTETDAEEAIAATKSALDGILEAASQVRRERMAKAQVSPERIKLVSEVVSRHIVERPSKLFPLSIVKKLTPVASAEAIARLNISGVRKGAFTEPPLEESFGQKTKWYNAVVSDQVCMSVLANYLGRAKVDALPVATAESFARELHSRARAIRVLGQTPILAVPISYTGSLMAGFRDIRGVDNRALNFTHRESQDPRSIVGYLEGIAIHAAALAEDRSYLVPLEDFHELEYGALESGNVVDVAWSAEADETIVLHFQWDISARSAD